MPTPGEQRSGSGVKSLSEKAADFRFAQTKKKVLDFTKKGLSNFNANTQGSLGRASNLNLTAAPIAGGLSIAVPPPLANIEVGEQIIRQAGIEKLMELLSPEQKEEKEKKETSSTETTKSETTPTQATNKPVEKASQTREEGRSRLEQLFLDLINGELNVKL